MGRWHTIASGYWSLSYFQFGFQELRHQQNINIDVGRSPRARIQGTVTTYRKMGMTERNIFFHKKGELWRDGNIKI